MSTAPSTLPLTLEETLKALESETISSRELVQAYLERIQQHADLNVFINTHDASALSQAEFADRQRKKRTDNLSPLLGVPIAHKDIFCTANHLTTCGSKMLSNFVAPYDATVVSKLSASGSICLGKTNMDEFAMGSSNENSHFGAVKNPWDKSRVPGGSSGGSAAAVAAGLAPATTGTDTGGSIRQPAAFCGVTGLKPTYGSVSRYGMIAFASSLDQGGPIAHTATDAAMLFRCMSGFDERDSTSSQQTGQSNQWLDQVFDNGIPQPQPLNIGLPKEYFSADIDPGVATAIDEFCQHLSQRGHTVTEVSLPHTDAAIPTYYVIAGAEASTNLSRYDGVRFGHRCDNPQNIEDLYKRSRAEGFGAEVKRRIFTGTYALSVGYYDAYYLKAQKIRRLIAQDFDNAFANVDLLVTPTTPSTAFAAGALNHDPVAMYAQDKFTVPVSLAGLPAISLPCGLTQDLPVGVQMIAPAFHEERLLEVAHAFQQATDWHLQTPAAKLGR